MNLIASGVGLSYYFQLPELRKVAAVRSVHTGDNAQKESIDFISLINQEQRIATLRIYEKPDWQQQPAEKRKAAGTVVLDFMDYMFVLSPKETGLYPGGSLDAQSFDAAYHALEKAISKAYVYNPNGVHAPVTFSEHAKDRDSADLYIGELFFRDKILFDAAGRPLFPARTLSEALGYRVNWDAATSSFIILNDDNLLAAQSVERSYTAESYKTEASIDCALIGGSVYVDMDFMINTLHCAASRHETEKALLIRAR
jgi:hypothetical protein